MRADSVLTEDVPTPGMSSGMIDTHHHIFDTSQFEYSPDRHLTPPRASVKQFEAFKSETRISRSVLVHGLSYGHDCRSLKTFLQQLDPKVTRGIAVIGRNTTDDEIQHLHDCGVRGIRLDLYYEQAMRDLDRQLEILRSYAKRIEPWGWSMGFLQLEPSNWDSLAKVIPELPVDVAVDHQGLMKASSMLPEGVNVQEQPGMQAILSLLRGNNFWIKISAPYRCSEQKPLYEDMRELVRCLIEANPRRVVYGSDWPHTPRMKLRSKEEALKEAPYLEVDDNVWLASLRSWLSEQEWQWLMVENPQRLYRFE